MILNIVLSSIVLISIYFVYKYKILGILAFIVLMGSRTDSAGIFHYLSNIIPFYNFLINILIFLLMIYSIYFLLFKKKSSINNLSKKTYRNIVVPIMILVVIMIISQMLKGYNVYTSFDTIVTLGIPFILIYVCLKRYDRDNMFFFSILLAQLLITFSVILLRGYLSNINGVSYWHLISNGNVSSEYVVNTINAPLSFLNFDKYNVNVQKFAQYHNPNSLGFYSSLWIVVGLKYFSESKRAVLRCTSILMFMSGVLFWFNSLTRGPILGIVIAYVLWSLRKLMKRKGYTYNQIFYGYIIICVLILSLPLLLLVIDYAIPSSTDVSVSTRLDGYTEAFQIIYQNPLVGVRLDQVGDSRAHVLFMKIAVNFGILASLISIVPFWYMLKNSITLFFSKKLSNSALYLFCIAGIVFGAYFTNGVIVYCMFWLAFVEFFSIMDNMCLKTKQNLTEV